MNDSQRASEIAKKYGATYVVLSFGAADGGALFAQWLRLELMRRRNFREPNNVYLDTVALSQMPGTTLQMRELHHSGGIATAGGLASINDGWKDYYKHAMSTASTMIFVATSAWFRSPWCGNELKWYIAENQERVRTGRQRLRGIALTFPDEIAPPGFSDMRVIQTKKVYAVSDPRKRKQLTGNYREFWMVDETTMQAILTAI